MTNPHGELRHGMAAWLLALSMASCGTKTSDAPGSGTIDAGPKESARFGPDPGVRRTPARQALRLCECTPYGLHIGSNVGTMGVAAQS